MFCRSDRKIDIILIHSHQMAIVVLAVVIFLFDHLREKRSVALTSQVLHVLNILGAHQLKIANLLYGNEIYKWRHIEMVKAIYQMTTLKGSDLCDNLQRNVMRFKLNDLIWLWPGGSVGRSIIPYTKRLWVQSPVRAHTRINQ